MAQRAYYDKSPYNASFISSHVLGDSKKGQDIYDKILYSTLECALHDELKNLQF